MRVNLKKSFPCVAVEAAADHVCVRSVNIELPRSQSEELLELSEHLIPGTENITFSNTRCVVQMLRAHTPAVKRSMLRIAPAHSKITQLCNGAV